MSLFSSFSRTFSRGSKPRPKLTSKRPPFRPQKPQAAPQASQDILNEANHQAREIIFEAKNQALKIRESSEEKNRLLIQTEAVTKQKLEMAKQQQQQTSLELKAAEKIKATLAEKLEKSCLFNQSRGQNRITQVFR